MINISAGRWHIQGLLIFSLIWSFFMEEAHGKAAVRYKTHTTVDFEEALVEGKSRKPYAAYLSQDKDYAMENLSDWDMDLQKSISDTQARLEYGRVE
jgi:hypothetical protein